MHTEIWTNEEETVARLQVHGGGLQVYGFCKAPKPSEWAPYETVLELLQESHIQPIPEIQP
jgi:hypothetical protein